MYLLSTYPYSVEGSVFDNPLQFNPDRYPYFLTIPSPPPPQTKNTHLILTSTSIDMTEKPKETEPKPALCMIIPISTCLSLEGTYVSLH